MFWHLRMILASKKTLGKFTKVLGFEKTPPPPLGKNTKKTPFFFWKQGFPKGGEGGVRHLGKIPQKSRFFLLGASLSQYIYEVLANIFVRPYSAACEAPPASGKPSVGALLDLLTVSCLTKLPTIRLIAQIQIQIQIQLQIQMQIQIHFLTKR